jgi:hypothetical protein
MRELAKKAGRCLVYIPPVCHGDHGAESRLVASMSSSQSAYWPVVQPWTSHSMRPTGGRVDSGIRLCPGAGPRLTPDRLNSRLTNRAISVRRSDSMGRVAEGRVAAAPEQQRRRLVIACLNVAHPADDDLVVAACQHVLDRAFQRG